MATPIIKHYYYVILETNGERQYRHSGLINLDGKVNPEEWLDSFTREFYSGFEEDEDGSYWFDWEVICEPFTIKELTQEQYETMKQIMA